MFERLILRSSPSFVEVRMPGFMVECLRVLAKAHMVFWLYYLASQAELARYRTIFHPT